MSAQPQLNVVSEQPESECSDKLLVDAWVTRQDSQALAALVRRYESMVWHVCCRQCRTTHDAEDAFQATFWILARDAKRIRRAESLGGWLHQVAHRTAVRTRPTGNKTEPLAEEPVDPRETLDLISTRHRARVLDDALHDLPAKYRDVLVLHYYQGHSYEQTAELLRTSEAIVRGRLARARKRLHQKLIRRGVALPLATAAIAVMHSQGAVAETLVSDTIAQAISVTPATHSPSHLESLLKPETSIMLSPSALSISGVVALVATGFAFAQVPSGPSAKGVAQESLPIAGVASEPVQQVAQIRQGVGGAIKGQKARGAGADEFGASSSSLQLSETPQRPKQHRPWTGDNAERTSEIERALDQPASLQYHDAPLTEVVQDLNNVVPALLDARALEEIGLSTDTPVSLNVKNVSLHSALRLMLSELDLTYTIDHEHLQIVTAEADESMHQMIRLYWSSNSGLQANQDSIELLQAMVSPESWSVSGGPGEISILGATNQAASGFAVRTTYQVHRQLEAFLDSIQAQASKPLSGNVSADILQRIQQKHAAMMTEGDYGMDMYDMMEMEMEMGGMMGMGEDMGDASMDMDGAGGMGGAGADMDMGGAGGMAAAGMGMETVDAEMAMEAGSGPAHKPEEGSDEAAELDELVQQIIPQLIKRNKYAEEFGENHPTTQKLDVALQKLKAELKSMVEESLSRSSGTK